MSLGKGQDVHKYASDSSGSMVFQSFISKRLEKTVNCRVTRLRENYMTGRKINRKTKELEKTDL